MHNILSSVFSRNTEAQANLIDSFCCGLYLCFKNMIKIMKSLVEHIFFTVYTVHTGPWKDKEKKFTAANASLQDQIRQTLTTVTPSVYGDMYSEPTKASSILNVALLINNSPRLSDANDKKNLQAWKDASTLHPTHHTFCSPSKNAIVPYAQTPLVRGQGNVIDTFRVFAEECSEYDITAYARSLKESHPNLYPSFLNISQHINDTLAKMTAKYYNPTLRASFFEDKIIKINKCEENLLEILKDAKKRYKLQAIYRLQSAQDKGQDMFTEKLFDDLK